MAAAKRFPQAPAHPERVCWGCDRYCPVNAMRCGKLGQQFVLKSKAAFEQLEFLGYETADSKEWYKKKAFRDQTARRQYFDVERNRRQRGDLYITTILDEEMKPNDPRLR